MELEQDGEPGPALLRQHVRLHGGRVRSRASHEVARGGVEVGDRFVQPDMVEGSKPGSGSRAAPPKASDPRTTEVSGRPSAAVRGSPVAGQERRSAESERRSPRGCQVSRMRMRSPGTAADRAASRSAAWAAAEGERP